MSLEEMIYHRLKELSIPYRVIHHEPVRTVAEAQRVRAAYDERGRHCKNLFLTPVRRGRGELFYLVVVSEEKRPDLRVLGYQVGPAKLQLTTPEELYDHLGLVPGAVSPLALVWPGARDITVVIDQDLRGLPLVSFHPGVNTATVTLESRDLERFLEAMGNPVIWTSIPIQAENAQSVPAGT